jgi:hypothetical protein
VGGCGGRLLAMPREQLHPPIQLLARGDLPRRNDVSLRYPLSLRKVEACSSNFGSTFTRRRGRCRGTGSVRCWQAAYAVSVLLRGVASSIDVCIWMRYE